MNICELFELRHSIAGEWLSGFEWPWQALEELRAKILELGSGLDSGYDCRSPGVWIHSTARIADRVSITGPCILGPETELRPGAFLRGGVLAGRGCVIGNASEVKNAILFDRVQLPHFNYVGDTIVGYRAHLGCGAVISNLRSDRQTVTVHTPSGPVHTLLRKFGALVGDESEVGCNAVLNPGTVLGRGAMVYPASCVRGWVPENSIWKNDGTVIQRRKAE
ncbi:MAG: UDP-N-acetylglucosamine pyrophosphorylase [Oscillospiraceae bacterium]|nr:UDP-N-acetylglucosamine pyrophosphorylase [Oscillospiraceae bacterium]